MMHRCCFNSLSYPSFVVVVVVVGLLMATTPTFYAFHHPGLTSHILKLRDQQYRYGKNDNDINCNCFLGCPSKKSPYNHHGGLSRNKHRIQQVQQRRRTTVLNLAYDDYKWKVGNVYGDLDRLEREINYSNGEENLKHFQRIDKLNHFAKSKYPIGPMIRKYILGPIFVATILRLMVQLHVYDKQNTLLSFIRFIAKTTIRGMDFHFWSLVVIPPIFLSFILHFFQGEDEVEDEDEKIYKQLLEECGLEEDDLSWIPPQDAANESTRNRVRFLTDYWTSAVLSIAFAAIVNNVGGKYLFPSKNKFVTLWWNSAQLLTRLAAMAALYQFPQQLYYTEWSQQPRPVELLSSVMQNLIQSMRVMIPLGVATDLSKVLANFGKYSLIAFYGTIGSITVRAWLRITGGIKKERQNKNKNDDDENDEIWFCKPKKKLSLPVRILSIATILSFWLKPFTNLKDELMKKISFNNFMSMIKRNSRIKVTFYALICIIMSLVPLLPIVIPLVHLRGISKISQIVYTHDLSLGSESDVEMLNQRIFSDEEDEKNEHTDNKKNSDLSYIVDKMKWRYRLNWRIKDLPLQRVIEDWRRLVSYKLLREGSVNDQFAIQANERIKNHSRDRLIRMLQQPEPYTGLTTKEEVMQKIANEYQSDYDRGSIQDPLGTAVQQTFGIGIGYNFDHMSPLKPGQPASLRRLQARAAKSALYHVQSLYAKEKKAKEEYEESVSKLSKNDDDDKKDNTTNISREEYEKKMLKMKQEIDDEVRYLAGKLTELIPTGPSDEFDNVIIETFQEPRKYVQVSETEMMIIEDREKGWKKKFGLMGYTDNTSKTISMLEADLKNYTVEPIQDDTTDNDGDSSIDNEKRDDNDDVVVGTKKPSGEINPTVNDSNEETKDQDSDKDDDNDNEGIAYA